MYPLWYHRASYRTGVCPLPTFDPLLVKPFAIIPMEDEDDALLVDGFAHHIVVADGVVADTRDMRNDTHGNLAMVEVEEPPPLNIFQEAHPLLL
ncbi:hypothetical protein AMTR_s00078p00172460 [Amborella trichopoda]|uniref:Uncharacterized protein n=1 Tax=Amborella trichopoda TaxID=13333 RepID=W1P206_AMBTC|nr:hypothetical protein AMTR_s00078p00172460 [Amborella trichopoda]